MKKKLTVKIEKLFTTGAKISLSKLNLATLKTFEPPT